MNSPDRKSSLEGLGAAMSFILFLAHPHCARIGFFSKPLADMD